MEIDITNFVRTAETHAQARSALVWRGRLRHQASVAVMTHRTLAGLDFRAHSPSLFEYHGAWIGYDGRRWRVGVQDEPWGTRTFESSHDAALFVYRAFQGLEEDWG